MLRGISTNIRNRRSIAYAVIGSAFFSFIALFLAPELMSSRSFADEPITVNPNITIGNSGSLSLSVNPNQFNSADQSITVTTSNYTGYIMTIAPSSGVNTELVNSETNTTIPSISSELTSSQFTNLSSTRYGLSINGGSNYLPVENGSTIKTTNSATNATTGAFTLTLGAKAVSGTPAGTYTKSFVLTATANASSYSITYNANTGSAEGDAAVSNMPSANESTVSGTTVYISGKSPIRSGYNFLGWAESSSATTASIQPSGSFILDATSANAKTYYAVWQEVLVTIIYDANGGSGEMPEATYKYAGKKDGDTIDLRYASNYSRAGYGFAGFSFDQNAYTHLTDNDQTNDPVIYGPNQGSITLPNGLTALADSNNKVKLYAVWVPAEKDGNNNPIYLQDWVGCANMSDGEVTALTDIRDGEVYAIAKIEKNKNQSNEYSQCWMMENMRIDIATANITADNTDNPTANFVEEAASLNAEYWDTCRSGSDCTNHISYSLANTIRSNTASYNASNQSSSWYTYGGMYNWYTATAGHGTFGTDSGNTEGSICPSNWYLPSGGSITSDYSKLDIALGGNGSDQGSVAANRWRTFPLNNTTSGIYSMDGTVHRGESEVSWTSTPHNSYSYAAFSITVAYNNLFLTTSQAFKSTGETVRCAIDNTYGIHYDANAGDATGTMTDQTVKPDTSANLKSNAFSRPVSGTTGYRFTGWNTQADGLGTSYADEASVTNLTTAGNTITLYAQWEQITVMPINFIGNGLSFADSTTTNTAYYYNDCEEVYLPTTRYSHTPNLLDDGSRNTSYIGADSKAGYYANSYTMNEVVTIPGASSLHIKLIYGGESATYDWVSIWSGSHPSYTAASDYSATEKVLLGNNTNNKYGGGLSTAAANTKEGDVTGTDTVTFAFKSDSSGAGSDGYGYYAIVTGYDSNGNLILNDTTTTICSRTLVSGEYKEPVTSNYQEFLGWSEDQNATTATYADSNAIINNLPGNNGETKTVYAIWRNLYIVHFNGNGSDSGSMTDQKIPVDTSANLKNNSFSRTGYKFLGWSEDQNATTATYANSASFTAPSTSGETTLYAIWKPQLKVIYHANYEGNSSTYTQWITAGESGTLASSTRFTRTGFKIARWDTASTGDGTSYAVSSSYTAPAGTQAGDELHLYAVWSSTYTVVYNANGGEGTMSETHTNIAEGDSVTLYASNFSSATSGGNPLYGFVGWSLVQLDPASNAFSSDLSSAVASGIVYGPNETISAPSYDDYGVDINNVKTITLYAVWVASTGNLQSFSCNSLASGNITALTDTRDNQVYAVAKLADGNCWMIENLRLDPAGKTLDNTNTNNPNSAFASTVSGLQSSSFATCQSNSSACIDQYSVGLGNLTSSISDRTASSQSRRWYSYGAMYNWYIATAGHGTYSKSSGVTDGDICPAGWHLPYGGNNTGAKGGNTSGGFYYLNYKLNNNSNLTDATASKNLRAYPNNFIYSGSYYSSTAGVRGSDAGYVSLTAYDNSSRYNLYLSRSSIGPGTNTYGKNDGQAIRCVADNAYTIQYDANSVDAIGSMANQKAESDISVTLNSNAFSRPVSGTTGYRFTGWNTQTDGLGTSYADEASVTNLTATGGTIILYAQWEQVTVMPVNFIGNSLSFADSTTTNTVYYYNNCEPVTVGTSPRYSHTPNLLDDGSRNTSYIGANSKAGYYANSYTMNEVITIQGASKLHIRLTWGGESASYDWVSLWEGNHPNYTANADYSSGIKLGSNTTGKYGGGTSSSSSNTLEGDIDGDTVTFAFRSDSSNAGSDGYGYYAVVTALDANGNTLNTGDTNSVCSRTLVSGEYKEPVVSSTQEFLGWSEDQNATTATYANSNAIIKNLPGSNGETKTVYAIWRNLYTVHFNGNGSDSGSMTDQKIPVDTSANLKNNSFSRTGYKFLGWSEDQNATTATYANSASFTAPSTLGETTLYAIWGQLYTIVYNANGGEGTMSETHTNVAEGDSINLYASNFSSATSSGNPLYGFAGWSTNPNAQPGGSSTIYGPNETIGITSSFIANADSSNTITLYAIWITSAGNLQGFSCNNLASGSVTALTDTRDNQVYAVAKLADGSCWMIENLRLDPAGKTLDSTNTNNPESSFATTVSGLQSSSFATCTSNSSACIDQYSVGLGNLTSSNSDRTTSSQSQRWYSYGAMYNWYAATAGHGTYSKASGVTDGDICPAGWHLPYGGSDTGAKGGNTSGGFYYLNYKLNNDSNVTDATASNNLRTYPNNFVNSGYYNGSSASSRGSVGNYWSSAAYNNGTGLQLNFGSSTVTPGTNAAAKNRGFAVRCVTSPHQTLTLSLDTGVTVEIDGTSYQDGDTVSLTEGPHSIHATLVSGYEFNGWSISGTGSSVASTSAQSTTLTLGSSSATLTALAIRGRAILDTGQNVNRKLKRLAGNSSATISTIDNTITAINRSNSLPNGFVADSSNTISTSTSTVPVYAWFNNGTIYYYSENQTVYLNPDSSEMFYEMHKLSDGSSLSSLDSSLVTNMVKMFYSVGSSATTFSLNLSGWDTSKVTGMSYMFFRAGYNATTFSLNLSGWDTSNVRGMAFMFQGAGHSATTWSIGDLSSWNTSKVTNMYGMFQQAGESATTWSVGNLSGWDTSKVTDMRSMFEWAGPNATTWSVGDLSSWNTSSVTDMGRMFYLAGSNATTWSVGNLSGWDTSEVTDMNTMFCNAGENASTWSVGDLSGWNTSKVTSMRGMFCNTGKNATTWSVGNLSGWDTSKVTDMAGMFGHAGYSATTFNISYVSSWNTSEVTDMGSMFSDAGHSATTWSIGDLSNWNTSKVTIMGYMFDGAGFNATTFSLNLSGWDTSKVTYMRGMFDEAGYNATTWSVGNLSGWDTSSVTNMSSMFSYTGGKATTYNISYISGWNTSSVTDMNSMFYGAGSYATTWSVGNLSGWNTSSVTDMNRMFTNAGFSATTFSLNLSGWNTSNVTDMEYMFNNAGRNTTTFSLNLSGWNTSNVTNMDYMFDESGLNATTWSVTIPRTNGNGITNNVYQLYGKTTSTYGSPCYVGSFTLAP